MLLWALLAASLVLYARPDGVKGTVITGIVGLLVVAACATRRQIPKPALFPLIFVGTIALLAIASLDQPRVSVESAAGLLVALAASSLLVEHVPIATFIHWGNRTMAGLIAVCVAAAVVPGVGITPDGPTAGALRGILVHRNGLGYVVFLGLLFMLARHYADDYVWDIRFAAQLAFYVGVLALAGSKSAMVIAGFVVVLWVVMRMAGGHDPRARPEDVARTQRMLTASGLFGLAALTIVLVNFWAFINLLGKRASLESRLEIWSGVLDALHPVKWVGYGWGNVLGDDDSAAATISSYSGYFVRSTHNGYLAVLLQVGIIGSIVGGAFLVYVLARAVGAGLRVHNGAAFWCLGVVLVLVIGDFSETRAFVNIGWFLLVTVHGYMAADALRSDGPGPDPGAADRGTGPSTPARTAVGVSSQPSS